MILTTRFKLKLAYTEDVPVSLVQYFITSSLGDSILSAALRKMSCFFGGGSECHAGKAFCAELMACSVLVIEAEPGGGAYLLKGSRRGRMRRLRRVYWR